METDTPTEEAIVKAATSPAKVTSLAKAVISLVLATIVKAAISLTKVTNPAKEATSLAKVAISLVLATIVRERVTLPEVAARAAIVPVQPATTLMLSIA